MYPPLQCHADQFHCCYSIFTQPLSPLIGHFLGVLAKGMNALIIFIMCYHFSSHADYICSAVWKVNCAPFPMTP